MLIFVLAIASDDWKKTTLSLPKEIYFIMQILIYLFPIFTVLCPILCNGRGEYVDGQCQCHPGWKGKECELKYHECEVPDCSGHGHCVDGVCHCASGFTGEFCEKGKLCTFFTSLKGSVIAQPLTCWA